MCKLYKCENKNSPLPELSSESKVGVASPAKYPSFLADADAEAHGTAQAPSFGSWVPVFNGLPVLLQRFGRRIRP